MRPASSASSCAKSPTVEKVEFDAVEEVGVLSGSALASAYFTTERCGINEKRSSILNCDELLIKVFSLATHPNVRSVPYLLFVVLHIEGDLLDHLELLAHREELLLGGSFTSSCRAR